MHDQTFVEYKGTAGGVHMSRRTNRGWMSACGDSAWQRGLVPRWQKSRTRVAKVERSARDGCCIKEGDLLLICWFVKVSPVARMRLGGVTMRLGDAELRVPSKSGCP
jgi:hypothetical protein